CSYAYHVLEPSGHYIYICGEIILSVRHGRIAVYAVGYDVVQVGASLLHTLCAVRLQSVFPCDLL
ncbi:MAG: hypothetical protein ACKPKO_58655, partial [Candidatus Fonsibacter sp.]